MLVLTPAQRGLPGIGVGRAPIRFLVGHADGADKMDKGDPVSRKSPVAPLINHISS
jgi:hypothetical protein